MANDVVFKTKAFGGFDKTEVMDFVNRIIAEKSELEKKCAEATAKCTQANAQLMEYQKLFEEKTEEKNEYNELLSKYEALQSECNSKDEVIASNEAQIQDMNEKLGDAVLGENVQTELETLRAEVSRLRIENEKKKNLERQVGAAMLDARMHSEELIEEAKQKADAVTKSVYAAIGETALKIDDLSGGIGEIARNFTKSVEEVELRIKALTGDMSKTAQLLIADSGSVYDTEKEVASEYDFSQSVVVEENEYTPVDFTPSQSEDVQNDEGVSEE